MDMLKMLKWQEPMLTQAEIKQFGWSPAYLRECGWVSKQVRLTNQKRERRWFNPENTAKSWANQKHPFVPTAYGRKLGWHDDIISDLRIAGKIETAGDWESIELFWEKYGSSYNYQELFNLHKVPKQFGFMAFMREDWERVPPYGEPRWWDYVLENWDTQKFYNYALDSRSMRIRFPVN